MLGVHRPIAQGLLASVVMLAACHTVRTVGVSEMRASRPPQSVWVTMPDGSPVLVQQPEVNGDTLVGMIYGEPARFPLADAVTIRARRPAPGRTAALAIASGAVLVGTFMYLQNRPDVRGVNNCYYSIIGTVVNPCCQGATDSMPC